MTELYSLQFQDVTGKEWKLDTLKQKAVALVILRGPDGQKMEEYISVIREATKNFPLSFQGILDISSIPAMIWWGIKKMKGEEMRKTSPEGLPCVLIDAKGKVSKKFKALPSYITICLFDAEGKSVSTVKKLLVENSPDVVATATVEEIKNSGII